MDHAHMNHGSMATHGMDMGGDHCEMNMLFTWNTSDLCIVFRWWHIRSNLGLILSLLAVIALTASYEAIRAGTRRYELYVEKQTADLPLNGSENAAAAGAVTERTPFLWPGREQVEVSKKAHVVKAFLYALQTFYAFMLMLLFMTYNGWVMLSVAIGAFLGYLVFGNTTSATKDNACH